MERNLWKVNARSASSKQLEAKFVSISRSQSPSLALPSPPLPHEHLGLVPCQHLSDTCLLFSVFLFLSKHKRQHTSGSYDTKTFNPKLEPDVVFWAQSMVGGGGVGCDLKTC